MLSRRLVVFCCCLLLAACGGSGDVAPTTSVVDVTTTTLPAVVTTSTTTSSPVEANLAVSEMLVTALYVESDSGALSAYFDMLNERTAEEMRWLNRFFVSIDEEILDLTCEPTSQSNQIECEVEATSSVSKPLEIESIIDTWAVRFDETNVTGLSYQLGVSPKLDDAIEWAQTNSPEVFAPGGACDGWFSTGPSPGECGVALVEAIVAYLATISSG